MVEIRRLDPRSRIIVNDVNDLLRQLSSGQPKTIRGEELREALRNPQFFSFVVTDPHVDDNDRYIGMATIFFQRIMSGWIAEIQDVVVDRKHEGRGIGKELMKQLLTTAQDFCTHHHVEMKLYLTSRPDRVRANALYTKLGFVQVATAQGESGTNLYKVIIGPEDLRGLT